MTKIKATGQLRLRVWRHGKLVFDDIGPNLVTDAGLAYLAYLACGDPAAKTIDHVGVGESDTEPGGGAVALINPFTKAYVSATYPILGQVKFTFQIGSAEANGLDIQEFGLLDSTDAVLFARRIKPIGVKTVDMTIDGEWTIKFQ
jgi:hypothetical protein